LGFGAMRLPMRDEAGGASGAGERRVVDEELAVPLMQKAFEMGVNYVDTAPLYCEGLSEAAVGKALKGWRDRVYLSTKNPIKDSDGGSWTERLEGSLRRLDTDCIDFYHFWGIGLEGFRSWLGLRDGPLEAAQRAKEQGLIRHLSFSFHDVPENFAPIADSGRFESVLIQYNLLDRSNEANLAYAKSKGLGVAVMGPVGGGRLGAPSEKIQGLIAGRISGTAEMALRFVLANESVDMALCGMSDLSMARENAAVASLAGHLTAEELRQVKAMMEESKGLADLYCTACDYCKPCPRGINIAHLFDIMNRHRVYGLTEHAKTAYREMMEGQSWVKSADASKCSECGACEAKCPQKLPIARQLRETHAALAPPAAQAG